MREVLALARADWLTATSYRTRMLMSLLALVTLVVPVYYVAEALQPVMANAIQGEGSQYFGFVLLGLVAAQFLTFAVTALPGAVDKGIGDGTLEALLSTRTSLPALLGGMITYPFIWAGMRSLVLLFFGLALGMQVAWQQSVAAAGILVLIAAAHLPFGVLATAMVIAFRTSGHIPQAVIMLSGFLGGVWYPTQVVPSWIQHVSQVLPLTYGLRALRRTLLDGASLGASMTDLSIVVAFGVTLMLVSSAGLLLALRYARRNGTLAQY